jgi:hypothetical protein
VKISEFRTPTIKFAEPGDCVDGTIVDEPALEPDKYDSTGQVLVLALLVDGVTKRLYARKQMLSVIAAAVEGAGVDAIECGGRLNVTYVDDKPTGGASPMKVYAAEYTPPTPVGTGELEYDGEPCF